MLVSSSGTESEAMRYAVLVREKRALRDFSENSWEPACTVRKDLYLLPPAIDRDAHRSVAKLIGVCGRWGAGRAAEAVWQDL